MIAEVQWLVGGNDQYFDALEQNNEELVKEIVLDDFTNNGPRYGVRADLVTVSEVKLDGPISSGYSSIIVTGADEKVIKFLRSYGEPYDLAAQDMIDNIIAWDEEPWPESRLEQALSASRN